MALTLGTTLAMPERETRKSNASKDGKPKTSTWQTSYKLDDAEDAAMAQRIKDDYAARNIRSGNAYVKWATETIATNAKGVGTFIDMVEALDVVRMTDFDALRKANAEALKSAQSEDETDADWIAELQAFEVTIGTTERAALEQLRIAYADIVALTNAAAELLESDVNGKDA